MCSPGVRGPQVTVFCSSTISWAEGAKDQNRKPLYTWQSVYCRVFLGKTAPLEQTVPQISPPHPPSPHRVYR